MSKVIELRKADDPRDVIHEAVQTLAEGKLVAVPTETVYVVAAHARNADAVRRLDKLREKMSGGVTQLAIRGAAEALDYVPEMSELGRKLIRRCWPGPVNLVFNTEADRGLLGALPAEVHQAALSADGLSLRVSSHDFIMAVLRLCPAPLLLAGETFADGKYFKTATDLADATNGEIALIVDDGPSRYGQPASVVKIDAHEWSLLSEGVVTRRIITRLAGEVYLFVCTGNTCRSPMAEGLFRKMLADKLSCAEEDLVDRGYVVVSAGLAAAEGSRPSPEAVQILADKGIDLRSHESQPVTSRLIGQADRIYTMTGQHRDVILREFPELGSRVKNLAANGSNISDPIGSGLDEYQKCADEIEQHLQVILSECPLP